MKAFVTGASGLAGSHLVEQLVSAGHEVVGLVRPTSSTTFLETLGVELVQGDVTDQASLQSGMSGADVVFHTAARVTDWGPWSAFRRETIEGTRCVLEAMRGAGVSRIVHMSSVAVYGYEAHRGGTWTEEAPYASRFLLRERYVPAKIMAEKFVLTYHSEGLVDATVIRPSWIYGPRDRAGFPRLVDFLSSGRACFIGSGDNPISLVYAKNLADACILAATMPRASGRIYNVCTDCRVTQRQYLTAITQALGMNPVTRHVPPSLALNFARISEFSALLAGRREPPALSRYGVYILINKAHIDSSRARAELGWQPRIGFEQGLNETVKWYRSLHMNPQSG